MLDTTSYIKAHAEQLAYPTQITNKGALL